MLPPLRIIIDTREQAPWAWDPSDATTEIRGLAAGDYALAWRSRGGGVRFHRFAVQAGEETVVEPLR
jgi:hypothetical protein